MKLRKSAILIAFASYSNRLFCVVPCSSRHWIGDVKWSFAACPLILGGDSGADDAFNQLLSVISQLILIIFHNFICGLATFRAVCAIMCYISNGGIVFLFSEMSSWFICDGTFFISFSWCSFFIPSDCELERARTSFEHIKRAWIHRANSHWAICTTIQQFWYRPYDLPYDKQ